MVVMSFLAVAAMVIVYAWLGQGGAVAGLILFGGLLAAVMIKLATSASSGS
jgi:prepilin signal peptidase PulO-like enzyme (type II secretory pathway)